MRPITTKVLAVIFFGLLLFSCKKDDSGTAPAPTASPTLQRVNDWLATKQQQIKNSTDQQTLAGLKENLIGSQLQTEPLNDKQNLIIVPLKNGFETVNGVNQQAIKSRLTTNQPSLKYLVITEGADKKLVLSNIIEVIPKDQVYDQIPAQLISKFYNNSDHGFTGIVRFLSLTNKFMTEREYKDGKIITTKHVSKKDVEERKGSASQRVTDCDHYYLVITTHYADGSSDETWYYLYSVCDNGGNTGGGGLGGNPGGGSGGGPHGDDPNATPVIDQIYLSEDETNLTNADIDYSAGATYILTRYIYHATVEKTNGEVTSVVVDPITASPMWAQYVDGYGRTVTRTLTLFSPIAYGEILVPPTSVKINWACEVIAVYSYNDGTSSWTRQWSKSKSTIM
jgi:hypothetical protein